MMIPERATYFLLLLSAASPCAFARPDSSEEAILTCAEDLHIPRHGPPGKSGDIVGPIVAKVVPDTNGGVKSVVTDGLRSPATVLVKSWLSSSTFARGCAGRELVVKFSFVIEGTPIDYPFSWVTFKGPNHFIVHSRPRVPHVFPVPKGESEGKPRDLGNSR